MSILKLETAPIGVMKEADAIAYCAGDSELFAALLSRYGLRPVKANVSRHFYRVKAIDAALEAAELAGGLVEFEPVEGDDGKVKWKKTAA